MSKQTDSATTREVNTVSAKIAEARRLAGWTQKEAARRCGLSNPSQLQKWEYGAGITAASLAKVAKAYGRPVSWFTGESEGEAGAPADAGANLPSLESVVTFEGGGNLVAGEMNVGGEQYTMVNSRYFNWLKMLHYNLTQHMASLTLGHPGNPDTTVLPSRSLTSFCRNVTRMPVGRLEVEGHDRLRGLQAEGRGNVCRLRRKTESLPQSSAPVLLPLVS